MALHSLFHNGRIRKFLRNHPEISMSDLESFYEKTSPVAHARADGNLFVFDIAWGDFDIIKCEDIRWVFRRNIRVRYMAIIPLGTKHTIVIYTKDGVRHELNVGGFRDKRQTEIINYIYPFMGNALFGYSDEYEKMWVEGKQKKNECSDFANLGRMQHLSDNVKQNDAERKYTLRIYCAFKDEHFTMQANGSDTAEDIISYLDEFGYFSQDIRLYLPYFSNWPAARRHAATIKRYCYVCELDDIELELRSRRAEIPEDFNACI